jgi:hypothetical protein
MVPACPEYRVRLNFDVRSAATPTEPRNRINRVTKLSRTIDRLNLGKGGRPLRPTIKTASTILALAGCAAIAWHTYAQQPESRGKSSYMPVDIPAQSRSHR